MEIDKKKISANWSKNSTHIDDIAYALYVKHCDNLCIKNGFEMTIVDQDTLISLRTWVKRDRINGMEDWDYFYIEAKSILRSEKIEKILNGSR